MEESQFRTLAEHPGYAVDSLGRVWTCKLQGGGRAREWRLLRQDVNPLTGVCSVTLMTAGVRCRRKVHILVLEAFVGKAPEGCEALHANDIAGDNRLENLRWGTRLDNAKDKSRNGGVPCGSDNHMAKLTREEASQARADVAAGRASASDIAARHGMSERQVRDLLAGVTYRG